jgi:hypothetical protein
MVQAVDDNTLLSHDDGIAAGQSYQQQNKTTTAVSNTKQLQHVTAVTGSSNGSANGTDTTLLHTSNGTHTGNHANSNGSNTLLSPTATASGAANGVGLGLQDLLGTHAATQV